jgi:hypothetical protein
MLIRSSPPERLLDAEHFATKAREILSRKAVSAQRHGSN